MYARRREKLETRAILKQQPNLMPQKITVKYIIPIMLAISFIKLSSYFFSHKRVKFNIFFCLFVAIAIRFDDKDNK